MSNIHENTLPVSVIIPTMNRPESLERTLCGLSKSRCLPGEVVVVDQSGSEDLRRQNQEALLRFFGKSGIYLAQQEPSLTKARNNGLAKSTNNIVICSDDDVDVYPETIGNVFALMSQPDISLVAGIDDLASGPRSVIGYFIGTKSFAKRNKGHVTKSLLGRYPRTIKKETPTEWAMGFFFAVKKQFMKDNDIRWDEHFTSYAYAEDLDFSYRYCKKSKGQGLKCVLSPSVRVKHLATLEYRVPSRKATFMYILNRAYICEKNHMGVRCRFGIRYVDAFKLMGKKIKKEDCRDWKEAARYRKSVDPKNFEEYLDYKKAGL